MRTTHSPTVHASVASHQMFPLVGRIAQVNLFQRVSSLGDPMSPAGGAGLCTEGALYSEVQMHRR